ncbi:unnamed protein product [Rotaria sp. Silwood2]|nr:unnamed protein product [Rotaria sp. Silwood2]
MCDNTRRTERLLRKREIDVESEDKCVENLSQVVKLLPRPIFIVMRYFFAFLNHLAEYSDENMMDASNLASCLAPTLMPIPGDKDQVQYLTHTIEIIRTMITHHEEIFPVNDDDPIYEKFAITIPIDGEEDEDEEGEIISERSLRRSPSDDEMEMVEAVALFDYNGRTHKELSFKKNQILFIYKKMNHEWWLGHIAGGNQSGFIPDGYIKLKSRRRDSAPVQHRPQLNLKPNPSSSITLPTLSNDHLNASSSITSISHTCHQSSNYSLVDEHRLKSAKETEIVEVDFDIKNEQEEEEEEKNCSTIENQPVPASRTIHDILSPNSPSQVSSSSSSHVTSINDQQIIDIDIALREILSGIQTVEECHAQYFRSNIQQDIDAPDLVLNLPKSNGFLTTETSKSYDEHIITKSSLPISHSTIIIDLTHTSRSNSSSPELIQKNKIPPPIMKKPEKTLQLMKRLGLQQTNESLSGARNSLSSSTHVNITHRQQQRHSISISSSSKATQV